MVAAALRGRLVGGRGALRAARAGASGVRLLVTGVTGFTGSALVRALAERGETVYALHRPGGAPLERLKGVELVEQDLSSPLGEGLPEVDAVVHLAQSRRYREFPEGAADVFEVNASATARLLDWARLVG